MNVGEIIKNKRRELGLTQKDLADALGMGRNGDRTIRRWENGETMPSQLELRAIRDFATDIPFGHNGNNPRFTFIDLFAGIGGIRIPFQELGGRCVFTSEWDKYAQKTYRLNFGDEPFGDITQIKSKDIPEFDILLGGFPCQPFSQAGLKKGISDTRGTLFFEIERIIEDKRPKAFLLENVKRLKSHDKGRTFQIIQEHLANLGYSVNSAVLRAGDFGVPQNRERIYIVGFDKEYFNLQDNYEFVFPVPPCTATRVGDILEENVDEKYTISDKLWAGHIRRRMENAEKGNGFGYSLFNCDSVYTNTLSARYYKDGSEILIDQGNMRNPRKLTPRECARLQGFPENFIIPVSDTRAYKQFGNSVAVPVIRAIANCMITEMERLGAHPVIATEAVRPAMDHVIISSKEFADRISGKKAFVSGMVDVCDLVNSKHLKNSRAKEISVLTIENGQLLEPVVIPKELKKTAKKASDYTIISGKDASDIYDQYGSYISRLKSNGLKVSIAQVGSNEYKKMEIKLSELIRSLSEDVSSYIEHEIEKNKVDLSAEQKDKLFTDLVVGTFRETSILGPGIEGGSVDVVTV